LNKPVSQNTDSSIKGEVMATQNPNQGQGSNQNKNNSNKSGVGSGMGSNRDDISQKRSVDSQSDRKNAGATQGQKQANRPEKGNNSNK